MTLKIFAVDPFRTFTVTAGTFAFYLKKIFWPYPLNFAIVQIDPLYELLAIPLAIICLRALISKTLAAMMFLSGVILYFPAVVIAFNQIAWTAYAERYTYLSSAFVIIGTALYIKNQISESHNKYFMVAGFVLILIAGTTSHLRAIQWQSNLLMMEDTVKKSPLAAEPRLLYGAILAENGEHNLALQQLEYGKKLPGIGYDERFDLNIADIYARQHQFDSAIKVLESGLIKSKHKSILIKKELEKMYHLKKIQNNAPR
jgi:hypothetical protein